MSTPTPVVWDLASNCRHKLSSYAWDQTEKYINIYITTTADTQFQSFFATRKVGLLLTDSDGKQTSIAIPNLCGDLVTEKCKIKQKPLRLTIKLRKAENSTEWSELTDAKDIKEAARKKRVATKLKDASTQELLADMYANATDEERVGLMEAAQTSQKKREEKA